VWVAISTSTESVAQRVLALIGLADDPRFSTFAGRMEHRDALETLVESWVGLRPSDEVLKAFEEVEAAIAPVYTMADLADDPHVRARKSLIEVDGVCMPGVVARMSRTPGRVDHVGRPLGADTDAVLDELRKNLEDE
jgi:crotonobetainyl-CoA:carnitine CoA-transferase CaiB-like acyl-CoA transferase